MPEKWNGWPDGKRFALVLTHDVDTQRGHDRCRELLSLEEELGFCSSFNFVAKRYNVSADLRNFITSRGFEVGVHGLYHDGKYYDSREEFQRRAAEINRYLKSWGAVGFRTPSMAYNPEWILDLNVHYDASTYDTDPFEPYSNAVHTIFPFWYGQNEHGEKGYVELPYTLPQDFTTFILLKERTIDIWKKKLDWIARQGGMALINTHPDYMCFEDRRLGSEEYPSRYYVDFLKYLKDRYKGQYWHVLARDMATYWARDRVEKF